jgi:hypothetical protein
MQIQLIWIQILCRKAIAWFKWEKKGLTKHRKDADLSSRDGIHVCVSLFVARIKCNTLLASCLNHTLPSPTRRRPQRRRQIQFERLVKRTRKATGNSQFLERSFSSKDGLVLKDPGRISIHLLGCHAQRGLSMVSLGTAFDVIEQFPCLSSE